jgi:hypothetical protein
MQHDGCRYDSMRMLVIVHAYVCVNRLQNTGCHVCCAELHSGGTATAGRRASNVQILRNLSAAYSKTGQAQDAEACEEELEVATL